ncbi:hypothetical protein EYF80_011773 [Liparis tanakae]|uniref:Uncharacterized protein n=1 Tax=Liparis tanakae TaxID=230148 RepID=A0A4Z2IJ60_9TELE|nr:hypothetical protein EYF80_011773 [Liparis tanakae]
MTSCTPASIPAPRTGVNTLPTGRISSDGSIFGSPARRSSVRRQFIPRCVDGQQLHPRARRHRLYGEDS